MRRKLSDRTIVIFLGLLLVAEILLLLGHMGLLPYLNHDTSRDGETPAGHIVHAENDLRRRSPNSLVWENYFDADPIYFHDSVLTLSQSEATLSLENNTQIHMAENTLLTIEPRDKDHPGEIRLRFQRGNLRAQNPSAAAFVDTETWSLDIKSGSDVDVRRHGDVYEALVRKGEARLAGPNGPSVLKANDVVKISGSEISRAHVDEQLVWTNPPPSRLYTHTETAHVALQWQGQPTQLLHHWQDQEQPPIALASQPQAELSLGLGRHTLYLQNSNGLSLPLEVQVWKAPIIHLLSPLPRDRVQIGKDIPFLWTFTPGLSGYRLELSGHDRRIQKPSENNSQSLKFDAEEDADWSVYGLDKNGFEIPPPYHYPIYIRENPLAAPKLKTPSLRQPAQANPRGAQWLQEISEFVLSTAVASEENYEALFEWEPVEGADHYVIEIADAPDFRHLIVTNESSKPRFIWRNFPQQTFYWRVAAGGHGGRMGAFSDAAVVNFQNISEGAVDGVQVSKVVTKRKVIATPVAKPAPKIPIQTPPPARAVEQAAAPIFGPAPPPPPLSPPPVVTPPPKPSVAAPVKVHRKSFKNELTLAWQPSFIYWNGSGDAGTKAQLAGGTFLGLNADWRRQLANDHWLRADLDYSQFHDHPQPASQYPFQSDLSWAQWDGSLFWHGSSEGFGYGATIAQNFGIHRTGDESVGVKSSLTAGPTVESVRTFEHSEYIGNVSLQIGAANGFASKHEIRWHFQRLMIGVGAEGFFFSHGGGVDLSATGFFLTGIQF